jgi:hypothetical protein
MAGTVGYDCATLGVVDLPRNCKRGAGDSAKDPAGTTRVLADPLRVGGWVLWFARVAGDFVCLTIGSAGCNRASIAVLFREGSTKLAVVLSSGLKLIANLPSFRLGIVGIVSPHTVASLR